MCGNTWRDWLLVLLVLSCFSLVLARAEPRIEAMTEEDLLDELIQNSEKLEALVSELKTNNQTLSMRLMIAGESLNAMNHFLTMQEGLLNETRTLHENYVADTQRTLSTTRIETWFWRIAAGLFAGATLYLSIFR